MELNNMKHYRYDFIGLSTDSKPTPATSEKVADGSTFYESNTSKLYVWYNDQWYEKQGGGGSYELPIASSETLGGIKVGSGLSINSETGSLSADSYTLPTASDTTLGGVKVGSGLAIADGVLSVSGGSGPTVVQTLGNSTTDVMSQNAVTSSLFADVDTQYKVRIGNTNNTGNTSVSIGASASCSGSNAIAIGKSATAPNSYGIAIGQSSKSGSGSNAIAIGANASTNGSHNGLIIIGFDASVGYGDAGGCILLGAGSEIPSLAKGILSLQVKNSYTSTYGYNNSKYRLITGVYDAQGPHDACTLVQGNTLSASAPTTSTEGVLGQLYTDTTNMHTYQCTAISGDTYTWTQRW